VKGISDSAAGQNRSTKLLLRLLLLWALVRSSNDRHWLRQASAHFASSVLQVAPFGQTCERPVAESSLIFPGSSKTSAGQIPRIIHQIWLGGPVPEAYTSWMNTWKQIHPSWDYRLWTDADLSRFPFSDSSCATCGTTAEVTTGQAVDTGIAWKANLTALMSRCSTPVQRSDLLRLDILYCFGGLYVDTDFECLRSFECFHSRCTFFAGMSNSGTVEVNNGLLASAAGHPIIKEILENLRISPGPPTASQIIASGPGLLTQVVLGRISEGTIPQGSVVFPVDFFYPFPNTMRRLNLEERTLFHKPITWAVHHWGCSWQGHPNISKEVAVASFSGNQQGLVELLATLGTSSAGAPPISENKSIDKKAVDNALKLSEGAPSSIINICREEGQKQTRPSSQIVQTHQSDQDAQAIIFAKIQGFLNNPSSNPFLNGT
jgi:mannosyltransferase OCH1-like enzyme